MMQLPPFTSTPEGAKVEGASPALLSELLAELERELTQLGVPFRPTVKAGMSRAAIVGFLEGVGLEAPEEVLVWFEWQDGPSSAVALGVLPSLSMVGVESATTRYLRVRATEESNPADVPLDFGIGRGWLPLGRAFVGLAVNCAQPASAPRPIRYANEDFWYDSTAYRAVSLCTYAAWMTFGLRSGAYVWNDETGTWNVDVPLLHPSQVAARFW